MRTRLFTLIAVCGLAAAGMSNASHAGAYVNLGVNIGPPAAVVETVPGPRIGYVWAPGYWRWDGGRHVWIGGSWLRSRPGYAYRPAYWVHEGPNWHFHGGYWHR